MKDNAENLLDAALLDDAAHSACLDIVRRAARRRRWTRRAAPGAVLVAVAVIGAMMINNRENPASVPGQAAPVVPDYVVTSHAMPAGFVVRTEARVVTVVSTSSGGVQVVSTRSAAPPEQIDDEALMQIAPGAVLVRHAVGDAELVFPTHETGAPESRAGVE